MDELKTNPIPRAEAKGLMQRYLKEADRAKEDAKGLRERIAKGARILALPDLTETEQATAEERMQSLQEALRATEWTIMLSSGLIMAWVTTESVSEMSHRDSLPPLPEGSLLRVYMPGVCDVTVKMDHMGEPS